MSLSRNIGCSSVWILCRNNKSSLACHTARESSDSDYALIGLSETSTSQEDSSLPPTSIFSYIYIHNITLTSVLQVGFVEAKGRVQLPVLF